ncbi:MAG: hypothetical protein OEX12_06085 [Gammaproteobacteria bacterium]|nr:hypothetical protein [Gammaproteobacteria bacterium]
MTESMSWPLAVLIAIDQLGNAIAGGNPDATVSARCYYFAQIRPNMLKYYWRLLELIINFAFLPIDGPQHCQKALEDEPAEEFYPGSDLTRAILGILVIIVCIPLSIIHRIAVIIIPKWRYKPV